MSKRRRTREYFEPGSRIGGHTSKQAGSFLFEDDKIEGDQDADHISKSLEMRSRITGKETMMALTYYGILRDAFESEAARDIADLIKRLLIGREGLGRREAVEILRGQLPKEIEIETGYEGD